MSERPPMRRDEEIAGRPEAVTVTEGWAAGEVTCDKCGDTFHLWFNGGELDGHSCKCGRRWFQEANRYDLKMREPAAAPAKGDTEGEDV